MMGDGKSLLFCFLAAAITASGAEAFAVKSNDNFVVHGSEAELGEVPWQASIQMCLGGEYECRHSYAAVIIDKSWLLSVASDFPHQESLSIYQAMVGSIYSLQFDGDDEIPPPNHTPTNGTFVEIEKVILHPDYNEEDKYQNNLVLAKLKTPLEFDEYIQPAALPSDGYKHDDYLLLSGWGLMQKGDEYHWAHFLQKASVKFDLPEATCKEYYPTVDGNILCGGMTGGEGDGCYRDEGGPAYDEVEGVLAGILVDSDCDIGTGKPTIAMEVEPYVQWIRETMENN